MSDTISCGIDAVRIRDLSDKVRCWIHGTTIHKRTAIQITIDSRTLNIHILTALSSKDNLVGIAIDLLVFLLVDSIDVNESIALGIADITGNSKRELEATFADTVAALEERLGTV